MQSYEPVFWGMAIMVVVSLAGGALWARCASTARSLTCVLVQSLAILVVVAYCATEAGAGGMSALLAIAGFMFSLVIGSAATLVARKVLRRRSSD